MKKSLLAAAMTLVSVAAFADTPLKDLKSVPAEVFLPEKVTFVEGEDDGTGGIDFTVATDAKVADSAAFIQAKAKEQGLQPETEEVDGEHAELKYNKMDAEGNVPLYSIGYDVDDEDGKRNIKVIFLDSRK